MASLCHPWFTTTKLSYRLPIFETSATALCGTTGNTTVLITANLISCPCIALLWTRCPATSGWFLKALLSTSLGSKTWCRLLWDSLVRLQSQLQQKLQNNRFLICFQSFSLLSCVLQWQTNDRHVRLRHCNTLTGDRSICSRLDHFPRVPRINSFAPGFLQGWNTDRRVQLCFTKT